MAVDVGRYMFIPHKQLRDPRRAAAAAAVFENPKGASCMMAFRMRRVPILLPTFSCFRSIGASSGDFVS